MDDRRIAVGSLPPAAGRSSWRRDELESLAEVLEEGGVAALTGAHLGLGRSQLAATWARLDAHPYTWIAWLDGATQVSLAEGVEALARHLGVGAAGTEARTLEAAGAALADQAGYLIVVDDAPPSAALRPLLSGRGHVIAVPAGGGWAEDTQVPVWHLEKDAPLALLAAASGRSPGPELAELAHSLGGLPLALALVGRVLAVTGAEAEALTLAVERLKRRAGGERDAEEEPGPRLEAEDPLEAWLAWQLAKAQAGPPTEEAISPALRAAVALAMEALTARIPGADEALVRASLLAPGAPLPALLGEDLPAGALDLAAELGLVEGGGPAPRIHPGVARALLEATPRASRPPRAAALAQRLILALGDPALGGGGASAPLASAAQALSDAVRACGAIPAEVVGALMVAARWLEGRGWPAAARDLALRAVEDSRQALEPGDDRISEAHQILAGAYRSLGQTDEAQYQLEEAVMLVETHHGADDPRVEVINAQRIGLLADLMRQVGEARPARQDPAEG